LPCTKTSLRLDGASQDDGSFLGREVVRGVGESDARAADAAEESESE
jgi:hypothetical protein